MKCDVCQQEKETTFCAPCGANICNDCQNDYPARAIAAIKANPLIAAAILAAIIMLLIALL